MMPSLSPAIAKRLPAAQEVLTWAAPAVLIPALRYFQDPKEQRNQLFVRDASTYTVGALLFLGTGLLGRKLLERWKVFKSTPTRTFVAFVAALAVNILYAGVGAVHLSKAFGQRQRQKALPSAQNAMQPWSNRPVSPWPQAYAMGVYASSGNAGRVQYHA